MFESWEGLLGVVEGVLIKINIKTPEMGGGGGGGGS